MSVGSAIGSAIGSAAGSAAGAASLAPLIPSTAIRDRVDDPILDRAGAYIQQRSA